MCCKAVRDGIAMATGVIERALLHVLQCCTGRYSYGYWCDRASLASCAARLYGMV